MFCNITLSALCNPYWLVLLRIGYPGALYHTIGHIKIPAMFFKDAIKPLLSIKTVISQNFADMWPQITSGLMLYTAIP